MDVVSLTRQGEQLAVLLEPGEARDGWSLPWAFPRGDESLSDSARRVVEASAGSAAAAAASVYQIGAFADDSSHPSGAGLSVAFVALLPIGDSGPLPLDAGWFALSEVPSLEGLVERHRLMIGEAVTAVKDRLDLYPVAFDLLPAEFTLSELQHMYELLLGRRLHKASFRRALQAASLVDPTDEWRSEGRGRPAQLYRYARKRRRRGRRGVRFDLLG